MGRRPEGYTYEGGIKLARNRWASFSESVNTWLNIPGIPLELQTAIVTMYQDLNKVADSRFTERTQSFEKVITDLRADLDESKTDSKELKGDLKRAKDEIDRHIHNDQGNAKMLARQADEIKEIQEVSIKNLATKNDIKLVKKEIKSCKKELRTGINLATYKAIIGMGVIVTLVEKFVN